MEKNNRYHYSATGQLVKQGIIEPFETTIDPLETTIEPFETTIEPFETTIDPLETNIEQFKTNIGLNNNADVPILYSTYLLKLDVQKKQVVRILNNIKDQINLIYQVNNNKEILDKTNKIRTLQKLQITPDLKKQILDLELQRGNQPLMLQVEKGEFKINNHIAELINLN